MAGTCQNVFVMASFMDDPDVIFLFFFYLRHQINDLLFLTGHGFLQFAEIRVVVVTIFLKLLNLK